MSRPVAHPTVSPTAHGLSGRPVSVATLTALALLQATPAVQAQQGLQWPATETLWPSVWARITLQTAAVSPLKLSDWGRLQAAEAGLSGGAVLGDYVFAEPGFGSFRATTGLFFGMPGEQPRFGVASYSAGSRLGLALGSSGARRLGAGASWQALPYLGVGFSSPLGDSGFSLSADLGLLAEPEGSGTGLRLRNNDAGQRDLRLAPLLQFGMRYTF